MTAAISPEQFLDPVWRLHNLYWIVDKNSKKVRFEPNWAQLEFIENIHKRNLILKARQLGFTTVCCLIYLDDCLFNPNVSAALVAHKVTDAQRIFRDKVKFPYDNLDEALRSRIALTKDSADTLHFTNNSSISVTTSARSGTLNWLHISEYGKICSQFPDKAEEIRTGSFPAAENGIITIESTAEGEGGDFYEQSKSAQELAARNVKLSRKEFKFFFYPWWRAPEYRLKFTNIPISPDDEAYFERVEVEIGQKLDQKQRNWWVAEEDIQRGSMKREYPATPGEAFEQAIEGAIFADDLAAAHKHRAIDVFPFDRTKLVHTAWDLGMFDETAIWLWQDHGSRPTFIAYYENSGEQIDHYLSWLKAWADDHKAIFGTHYLPHDGDRKSIWIPGGTMGVMGKLGFKPRIVERTPDKVEAIRQARRKFGMLAFDANGCKEGLARLKQYRKEWDDRRGVWREKPHHGPESNGADAFLTFVQSGHSPSNGPIKSVDRYRRDRDDDNSGSWMTA